ncbi:MAG: hypothetical protein ABI231_06140 [Candidatus Tumulicola sp.]
MRSALSVLVLAVLVAACGSAGGALPYHASSVEDSMGMTVEQYAIGRLPATHRAAGAPCPKPGSYAAPATRRHHAAGRCRRR